MLFFKCSIFFSKKAYEKGTSKGAGALSLDRIIILIALEILKQSKNYEIENLLPGLGLKAKIATLPSTVKIL